MNKSDYFSNFTRLKGMGKRLGTFILLLACLWHYPELRAQETPHTAVAAKGDGILSLLRRNGLSPSDLEAFVALNAGKLGPDNTLYEGRKYLLPGEGSAKNAKTGAVSRSYPIFGHDYQEVTLRSDRLKGAVYYLVSGHGGPDPGAVGKYQGHTLCEDEYAYDVTLRLARNLIENGATVYLVIRDPDDGIRDREILPADRDEVCHPRLAIPLNQVARLKQRTHAVNRLYNGSRSSFRRMVAIHVDARSRGENIDVFFYHDKRSRKGEKAATLLKEIFEEKYKKHQPNRGYRGTVSARDLYVVTHSKPVAVYIELGNINHRRDQQRIVNPGNRQALANWLTEGLIRDFRSNR